MTRDRKFVSSSAANRSMGSGFAGSTTSTSPGLRTTHSSAKAESAVAAASAQTQSIALQRLIARICSVPCRP